MISKHPLPLSLSTSLRTALTKSENGMPPRFARRKGRPYWMRIFTFLLSTLAACGPDAQSAQGVAEQFLDAHYVTINLPLAKTYTTGLALSRIEDEIRLTEGQQIDAGTRKPRVNYRLLEEKQRGEKSASFLYEATFSVDGAGQFIKKVLLTLRQSPEGWHVTNYSEFD